MSSTYGQRQASQEQPAQASTSRANPGTSTAVGPGAGAASEIMRLQTFAGNGAVTRLMGASASRGRESSLLDVLSTAEGDDGTGGTFLDAVDADVADAGALDAVGTAVPVDLQQILTSWTPGPTRYGFQLKFRCGSSSGQVSDLQAQAPNLKWREYVTYSRNDFAHRINPPNPTILPPPPGGVSFAPSRTTVISPNVIEFIGVTDTHWMPTSAVRDTDFQPAGPRPLPGIMESSQLYQYTTDNSTWTTFAGPFTLRRELNQTVGPPLEGQTMPLYFATDKVGIHSVTEPYKP
ncbi:hypothetical protein ALI144C_31480 [Actinosynnema sp. ALI-1.44]|uniref:hypothetical protein n=1 Tax=Actinosynnema sp. ALI-1.44 TaxID=1933779 RepID=UPI00097CAFBB|nr:hypothetical protein [Actinosynnema sp. ALI-1.44]ONI77923.1 hypothetical protein ALI144C_31480 [Actinosynnema sp. ALI-1.44]